MQEEKSVIGIKFHKEIESAENTDLPISNVSVENFGLGEKLNVGKFIDSQVLKLFREQGEHLKASNLIEAIFLGDNHIYKDTLKCVANFIIANPSIREDLEKLIKDKDNDLTDKTYLYSNLVGSNEIICIHSDEIMFPAHLESNAGSFAIKMDNPCLVKVITFLKRRYFIAIEKGNCKDCGYPIICEAGLIAGDCDFHIYCSNPDCQNHAGVNCGDMEIDKEHIPFLQSAKE